MSNDHYFLLVAYLDNVKLHKCAIRLGTSTTRIARKGASVVPYIRVKIRVVLIAG